MKSSVGRISLASIVLLAGLPAAGCRYFDRMSSNQVQVDWDNPDVGQMAMRMYLRTHRRSQQPEQRQLVEEVGARLAEAAGRPDYDWRFELVDDPQPDIVVFPAGNVAVTEGMIVACQNEAEFAGALAHELGHMLAGHAMHHAPPNFTADTTQTSSATTGRESQDEIEADSIALSLLARAGYDPRALVAFWRHADANPERIAFVDAHADRNRQLAELDAALAQAQQIYRANPARLGLGIRIARDESAKHRPADIPPGRTRAPDVRWTAATEHPGAPSDPRGATKPSGWNADLLEEGDWMMPVETGIQQAGFDWSPAGTKPAP